MLIDNPRIMISAYLFVLIITFRWPKERGNKTVIIAALSLVPRLEDTFCNSDTS